MTESEMTAKINQRVRKMGVHAWKINANFAKGVPDCWYSGCAGDLWAEFKHLPNPPKRQFSINLSTLQAQWLRERHSEGRNVAVIVTWDTGFFVTKEPTTFNARQVVNLQSEPNGTFLRTNIKRGKTALSVAEWICAEICDS